MYSIFVWKDKLYHEHFCGHFRDFYLTFVFYQTAKKQTVEFLWPLFGDVNYDRKWWHGNLYFYKQLLMILLMQKFCNFNPYTVSGDHQ